MKMRSFLFVLAAGTMIACGDSEPAVDTTAPVTPSTPEATNATYTIDPAASTVTWTGSKITGSSHTGTIAIKSGTISTEGDMITAGNFTIDMTTMTEVSDDAESAANLIHHLKSPDFFMVDSFPEASFEISGVTVGEGDPNSCKIAGNLTILGKSNNIEIAATVSMEGDALMASSSFTIDRTKWGISFQPGTPVDGVFEKVIEENIAFSVSLVGSKK